jgi:hypothetical protein
MKRVKVLIPFHNKDTQVNQLIGDIIEVSDEKLASIRKVNVNMVLVLEDVNDNIKTNKTKEVKAETKEVNETNETNEVIEVKKIKPKKTTKKTTK